MGLRFRSPETAFEEIGVHLNPNGDAHAVCPQDAMAEPCVASTSSLPRRFRLLPSVVKPGKAVRQMLPIPGKPHRSGPARPNTG